MKLQAKCKRKQLNGKSRLNTQEKNDDNMSLNIGRDTHLLLASIALIGLVALSPLIMINAFFYESGFLWNNYFPNTGWIPAWILTVLYAVITTFFQLFLGLLAAILFYFYKHISLLRRCSLLVILLLPYSIPPTITVMMFDLGLADNGYLNNVMEVWAGLAAPVQATPLGRFICMCLVSVWQYFPFFFIVFLISLNSVPDAVVRQAELDGASCYSIALDILIPLSIRSLIAATVLRLVLMIGKIDIALIFDKKSAVAGAETLPVQIIEQTFSFGVKTPTGLIFVLALILITPIVVYMISLRRDLQ